MQSCLALLKQMSASYHMSSSQSGLMIFLTTTLIDPGMCLRARQNLEWEKLLEAAHTDQAQKSLQR